ncbi:hypothetical protein ACKAV7_006974 [Fusarium commune]
MWISWYGFEPCPYRRPGYLYVPAEEERYRETRWMPFTSKFLDSEDPETAAYLHSGEDLIFNDTDVLRTYVKGSDIPIEWMKLAVKENRRRQEAMAHIKNETSKDYHRMRNDGEQPAGGFTYRPDWFWYKQMRIIPFERRWEELWQPHERDIQGPNGRPDLILWQNGLWDQRGFQVGGQKLHEGQNVTVNGRYRKLVWDELHFVLARTKKYAEMIIRVSVYSYDVEKFNVSLKDWIGRYHGN